jgi:D-alanine-D-alanine ligase-like ATP-grasp enzyme
MVERYLPGHDFRLLVIGNKLVAAARRDPPQVVGDGKHTVRELVDIVNADPRRGSGHSTSLTKIRFDDIAWRAWRCKAWKRIRCRPTASASSCATTPTCRPAAPPPTSPTTCTRKWRHARWKRRK